MRSPRLHLLALLVTLACACGPSKSASAPSQPIAAAEPRGIEVGDEPPSFTLDSVNGAGRVSLRAWRGDVVVVTFWATWSEPDKKLLIKLEDMRKGRTMARVHFVGVSIDDEEKYLPEFATTYGIKLPIVWEADRATTSRWRPTTDPATYILDKKGVVRFVHRGFHDGEDEEMAREIDGLT
jgi:peroxiredoxin